MPPSLTVIAGPNGSGKTTLTSYLRDKGVDFGHYINPDDIAATLSGDDEARFRDAQKQAERLREDYLRSRVDFSFETVMSHPSKLEVLRRAKLAGYNVTLFYVGIEDPEINIARVAERVSRGGHDVPRDKIAARYLRTMEQLCDAVLIADRSVIFDNTAPGASGARPGAGAPTGLRPVSEVRNQLPLIVVEAFAPIPAWTGKYLLRPLEGRDHSRHLGDAKTGLRIVGG